MMQMILYPEIEFNRAPECSERLRQHLDQPHLQFIESIARALDARDSYTAGHSDRVGANSVAIAQAMNLPPETIESIDIGAKLHDIGKIGIPDAILQKKDLLTEEEFSVIRQHPGIGKKILERVDRFECYLGIVELHHENLDGSGYPYGLKGDEIPIEARIVHVTDVYDALTGDRAYRKAMSDDEARELLRMGIGTQFDPYVVEVFLSFLEKQCHLGKILWKASSVRAENHLEG
jgi:putative two-component system response regulator